MALIGKKSFFLLKFKQKKVFAQTNGYQVKSKGFTSDADFYRCTKFAAGARCVTSHTHSLSLSPHTTTTKRAQSKTGSASRVWQERGESECDVCVSINGLCLVQHAHVNVFDRIRKIRAPSSSFKTKKGNWVYLNCRKNLRKKRSGVHMSHSNWDGLSQIAEKSLRSSIKTTHDFDVFAAAL